jgi:hypothetical protein
VKTQTNIINNKVQIDITKARIQKINSWIEDSQGQKNSKSKDTERVIHDYYRRIRRLTKQLKDMQRRQI